MSEDTKGLNRRQFLTIIGASGGAVACSPKHGPGKIVPLLTPPAEGVPGKPTFYRSLCRECPAGCGVTARTREGRVVKLEGNPEHPVNRGALCARGQAGLTRLYDPRRPRTPLRRTAGGGHAAAGWEQALDELAGALRAPPLGEVVVLSRAESGSLGAIQEDFTRALGDRATRIVYEPFDPAALRAASQKAFGLEEVPVYRIDRAAMIVSLGADFLESWLSPVEHARMLSEARSAEGGRAKLLFLGPYLGVTAAAADSWIPTAPGAEREIALALCREIQGRARGALPPEGAAALGTILAPYDPATVERKAGLPAGTLAGLARDLLAAPSSVVLPPAPTASGTDATAAALAVTLLNQLLGNHGKTVLYGLDPGEERPAALADLRDLASRMAAGRVSVLITVDADPVATLPAELRFAEAMAKVPLTASIATGRSATGEHSTYILPELHTLETWSDSHVRRGILGLGQPVMRPIFDARSSGDILLELGARLGLAAEQFPFRSFEEFWRDRASSYAMLEENWTGDLLAAVRSGQQVGGFFSKTPRPPADVTWQPGALEAFHSAATELSGDPAGPILALAPDLLRYDGRSGGLPWMEELGDPVTTVAWATPLVVAPALAAQLGVEEGDVVRAFAGQENAEFPIYVWSGLAPGVVALSAGSSAALALLPAKDDHIGGGRAFLSTRVRLARTGKHVQLVKYEGSQSQQGRDLFRTVPSRDARLPEAEHGRSMYPPAKPGARRWAMAVDLDRCTGCEACVAACYAENNLPVVGADQVSRGRAMRWIRIERYVDGRDASRKASFLPMLCQQCGEAPCEMVCPADATYHNPEGLNAQVYNRCIGTRYCANNCPYKVRVFNFEDHAWPEPEPMRLNPDVTVRDKGVMEKCTFCVQRIRLAENMARDEGRPLRDGDVVPACVQTCPSRALTFGDLQDKGSAIFRVSKSPRGYHVLGELNTQPAITYLARVDKGGRA